MPFTRPRDDAQLAALCAYCEILLLSSNVTLSIAEESSATSEELSAESISLNELVQQFKLKK